jgi:ankyrin repeat protein
MPDRVLPARPNLDHLKNEAKALHKAFNQRDAAAIERIRDTIGDQETLKLTDAQRAIAREYGFPTWARLRGHVQSAAKDDDPIAAFLTAAQEQDRERAQRVLDEHPEIATASLHVASALGHAAEARRLIAEDPSRVNQRVGSPAADPLLYLGYSPFHGESPARDAGLLETARVLLDAGANPNTRDDRYGVPVLHSVTGQRSVPPIARLLLDAGANPTDGESVFHAAEHFHEKALELLLEAGVQLNYVGEWGNTAPYFLLRWWDVERTPNVRRGLVWLLEHGADPNIPSARERETCLHVAARRGQDVAIVQLLLDHGADVTLRRGDGCTAWLLAQRSGFDAIAQLLERAGALPQPLSATDELLAACGRGDAEAARRLASPETLRALSSDDVVLLPEAAMAGRWPTVTACVAAGFPVDVTESSGATALHYAAIEGRLEIVELLLAHGANLSIVDKEHSSTPLGWATWGSEFLQIPSGDYPGTVRALIGSGARLDRTEHVPANPDVRAALDGR